MKRFKNLLFVALLGAVSAGCQPAVISSAMRVSDAANSSMETRCEPLDMRETGEIKRIMSSYDGWRMIYVSEYTTGNRFGTHSVVCFERPKK